jgi:hypothetical protein
LARVCIGGAGIGADDDEFSRTTERVGASRTGNNFSPNATVICPQSNRFTTISGVASDAYI